MSGFEWLIALRYLRARREERLISVIGWFSLIGITLGVATLIVVMSVMNGFRGQFLERILGLNGHLAVYGPGRVLEGWEPLATALKGLDGVVAATPVIEAQVMVSAGALSSGALVRGLRPDDLLRRPTLAGRFIAGAPQAFGRADPALPDPVVMGYRLARKLELGVGALVTLISPRVVAAGHQREAGARPAPAGLAARMRAFEVVALFNVGMVEYDAGYVFMPLAAAQDFLELGAAVTGVEVFVAEPLAVAAARARIEPLAAGRGEVIDWRQANAILFNALDVERGVTFVIVTLIIVVAVFNIVASLTMLVKDKGREIAILRTMGASRGAIVRIFMVCGASVGLVGTALGAGLGLGLAANIGALGGWLDGLAARGYFVAELNFLSRLPSRIDGAEVAAVIAMGLVLSALATLYPSWRAARLDPVEALRHA